MHEYDVVVIGAGPAGLLIAGDLAALGRSVAVIDRRPTIGSQSRAFAVMPRTLEVLRQRGLADAVSAAGHPQQQVHLPGGAVIDLSELDTPFPHVLVVPQYEVETVLAEYARRGGVDLLRNHEAVGIELDRDRLQVQLRHRGTDGPRLGGNYVVAADGAHSTIRHLLGLPFPGRSAIRSVILADAEVIGTPPDGLSMGVADDAFSFVAPYGHDDRYRVMAWDRNHQPDEDEPVDVDELRALVRRTRSDGTEVGRVEQAWRFHSDERQLRDYRHGRVLFVGDAAHVHSPVGGQGMNTGIQDAANLAWKLAAVLGGAAPDILDTYQSERHPVGRRVVLQSRAMLRLMTMPSLLGRPARAAAGFLLRIPVMRRRVAGMFAGTALHYSGAAPVGRRAATIPVDVSGLLIDAQDGPQFVLAVPAGDEPTSADDLRIVHRDDDGPAVLVRPDGYIAWSGSAAAGGWDDELARWSAPPTRYAVRSLRPRP